MFFAPRGKYSEKYLHSTQALKIYLILSQIIIFTVLVNLGSIRTRSNTGWFETYTPSPSTLICHGPESPDSLQNWITNITSNKHPLTGLKKCQKVSFINNSILFNVCLPRRFRYSLKLSVMLFASPVTHHHTDLK